MLYKQDFMQRMVYKTPNRYYNRPYDRQLLDTTNPGQNKPKRYNLRLVYQGFVFSYVNYV